MLFPHRGQIHIDEIEKVEIYIPSRHIMNEKKYLNLLEQHQFSAKSNVVSEKTPKTGWIKALDVASKIVAFASSLGIVILLTLLITGVSRIGNIQTDSILTIFGFTLFGSLISVGGAELFSVSLNLRKAEQKINEYEHGCPFIPILEPEELEYWKIESDTRIPNPSDFCGGCPFGERNYIDRAPDRPARCKIYNENYLRAKKR